MAPPSARIGPGWRVALALLRSLPQGLLSRALGRAADVPLPRPLRRPFFGLYAALTGADPTEAERALGEYRSFSEFFVRRLKAGARSWPEDATAIASPVDGLLGATGRLRGIQAFQAKGREYSVVRLLDDPGEAERFRGGSYATLYLSPRHYHRVHAPVAGKVTKARHVPGRLLPVNDAAVRGIPELFPRNERLVCYLDGAGGRIAVVAVGAFNVGRISTAFDVEWNRGRGPAPSVTNRRALRMAETRRYDPPVEVDRGDELMAFHLGSTVILLFEGGGAYALTDLVPGAEVRLGQLLGTRIRAPGTERSPEPRSGRR